LTGHKAIAKQNFCDQLCAELAASRCAFNSRLDGGTTEVVRRQGSKVTLKTAHGRARCADNDNGILGGRHVGFS
jgi:hypothetical protein